MKKKKILARLLLMLICSFALPLPASAAMSVEFLRPSALESRIAPNRDFYVIGRIDTDWPAYVVSIDLYRQDAPLTPIRNVRAERPNFYDGIYAEYVNGTNRVAYSNKGTPTPDDIRRSGMPDLVYDPTDLNSFGDVWRKCFYTGDGYFAALFCGGTYSDDIRMIAEDGSALESLAAGEYTVVVSIGNPDGDVETAELYITIDDTPDKIAARFSPAAHKNAVAAFAKRTGYRVYDDPFAGYWSAWSNHRTNVPDGMTVEILPRWRGGEHLEYATGTTHVAIYNISETCTTNAVEVGLLQQLGTLLSAAKFYYYDIAEPILTVDGTARTGELVRMAPGDRLEPIRLDAAVSTDVDNAYSLVEQPTMLERVEKNKKKWDLSDFDGTSVALSGVVTPILNLPSEIDANDDGTFRFANRIAKIVYTLKDEAGKIIETTTREVGLTRKFAENYNGYSIYEYRHVFTLPDRAKYEKLTLEMAAYDANGAHVSGTNDAIELSFVPEKSSFLSFSRF